MRNLAGQLRAMRRQQIRWRVGSIVSGYIASGGTLLATVVLADGVTQIQNVIVMSPSSTGIPDPGTRVIVMRQGASCVAFSALYFPN